MPLLASCRMHSSGGLWCFRLAARARVVLALDHLETSECWLGYPMQLPLSQYQVQCQVKALCQCQLGYVGCNDVCMKTMKPCDNVPPSKAGRLCADAGTPASSSTNAREELGNQACHQRQARGTLLHGRPPAAPSMSHVCALCSPHVGISLLSCHPWRL